MRDSRRHRQQLMTERDMEVLLLREEDDDDDDDEFEWLELLDDVVALC